jgi:hypothetical protein
MTIYAIIPDRCGFCNGAGNEGEVLATLHNAFIGNPVTDERVNAIKSAIKRSLNSGGESDYDKQSFNHTPPL